ncbi:MFS transporter [Streptomyces sp. NPDC006798]|uniref:MFS transporter n=1 Tax=Streptomyces sp. NPDC006798 TaxID=3155462 RepID=UPI0033C5CB46
MGTVALVNLLGLVYAARFLAAPLVDRVRPSRAGRYRGVLISTQLALVAILLALAPLDPVADLPRVLVLTVLLMLVSMVHDTALAGFTVRLVPPGSYGTANGVQTAAASLSMLIGSGGALLLYARAGWTAALVCLALVYAVPLAVLSRVAEPAVRPAAPDTSARAAGFGALLDYLRRPRTRWWALAVIPAFAAGGWLVSGPQSAMLLDAGWQADRIALVQSVGYGVQTVAALVMGAALTRFGVRRCAPVLAVAGIVGTAALLPLALGHAPSGPRRWS